MNDEAVKGTFEGVDLVRKNLFLSNDFAIDAVKYYNAVEATHKKNLKLGLVPEFYEYPRGAQMELTFDCNQRCIHCYNQSGAPVEDVNDKLSHSEWLDIARQLGEAGIFQCVISGGEPTLLGERLYEIMDVLASYDVRFILITNGMLMNESTIRRLQKYKYSWLQVSIDGSRPELHDYIRGVKSWDKAIHAANLVKQAGLPLVIAHAITKVNCEYVEEMIDLAYLLGASQLTTGPYERMGRAIVNDEKLIMSKEETEKVFKIIEKKRRQYQGLLKIACTSESPFSMRFQMIQPNDVMLIRPNGDVKVDCNTPFIIGNVKKNTIKELWDMTGKYVYSHPRMKEYVNSIHSVDDFLTVRPRVNVDKNELLVPYVSLDS